MDGPDDVNAGLGSHILIGFDLTNCSLHVGNNASCGVRAGAGAKFKHLDKADRCEPSSCFDGTFTT